jgi:hypothetical protein
MLRLRGLSDEAPTVNLEMAIWRHGFQIHRYRRKIYADYVAMRKLLGHGESPDQSQFWYATIVRYTNTPDTSAAP